jgi:uncharacterized protein
MNPTNPHSDPDYGGAYEAGFGSSQTVVDDQNTWAILSHIGGLVGAITSVPFGGCIAPLAIWLTQREKGPVVEHHAREALNFHLTVSIVWALAILMTVLTLGLGVVLLIPLGIAGAIYVVVASIMAAVAASNGEPVRYSANFNLIKPWRPPGYES